MNLSALEKALIALYAVSAFCMLLILFFLIGVALNG